MDPTTINTDDLVIRFEEAVVVLEPVGHALVIRYAHTLMTQGHFEDAHHFVKEAARRLGLGLLSDLSRAIRAWSYARGTKEALNSSRRWREVCAATQRFTALATDLHQNASLLSLSQLDIKGLDGVSPEWLKRTEPAPVRESAELATTGVWLREDPPKKVSAANPAIARAPSQTEIKSSKAVAIKGTRGTAGFSQKDQRSRRAKVALSLLVAGLLFAALFWTLTEAS